MICEKCGYFNPKKEETCQRCGVKLDVEKQAELAAATPVRRPAPGLGWLPALGGMMLLLTLFIPGPNFLLFHASTIERLADLGNAAAFSGLDWFYLAAGLAALLLPLATMLSFLVYLNMARLSRATAVLSLAGLVALALAMSAFIRDMLELGYFEPLFMISFLLTAGGLILVYLPTCRKARSLRASGGQEK